MKKLNNKGFTLVELLAVIVILIAIMSIAIPSINSAINRNKETQNKQRIKMLESAALEYVNDEINNGSFNCINLNTLLDKGYISSEELKDADGNNFNGYMKYNGNEYKYVTSGNCDNSSESINNDNDAYINKKLELGDYVSMTPTKTIYTTETSETGYTSTQTIYPSELNVWRVIRKNVDKSVDVISDKVSSTTVYFYAKTGYKNFVGYLNFLAAQYKNETYTSKTRYFGYNGQTEYIEDDSKFTHPAPWTCSTGSSCNSVESQGGGDTLYQTDYNLVNDVYGSLVGRKATNNTVVRYWMASRNYYYADASNYYYMGRIIYTDGSIRPTDHYRAIHLYYAGGLTPNDRSIDCALRPIVTLKANLKIKDDGNDGKSESTAYNLEAS